MTSRHLRFRGGRQAELAGILDLPETAAPSAFAILAHCFTCTKELKSQVAIARVLTEHGLGVLRFDFTGLGESAGSFAETGFAVNVDDLLAAAEFLRRTAAAPQLLIGHSLGGTVCLGAAARLLSVRAVVTIGSPSTPASLATLLGREAIRTIETAGTAEVLVAGRPFTVGRSFLADLAITDFATVIGQLGKALLVLHAPGDTVVNVDHAARIFTAARHPKSFVSLDTADHLLLDDDDARYAGTVIAAWASRYLR
ncbi:alpha/beta hydrolase [Geotalea uraniireducens]|uniref:Alpha/beta hydrolase n=1 Tax=Geotalea uraniireducens TaxID=351604 RepID=A0ABN6VU71_9BACT|nr:alpha/beta fold hydrolase [Geotalea uraniireducens]BDV43843.1 alpha/beta hydrolase [Geotalea uraniireducens]